MLFASRGCKAIGIDRDLVLLKKVMQFYIFALIIIIITITIIIILLSLLSLFYLLLLLSYVDFV